LPDRLRFDGLPLDRTGKSPLLNRREVNPDMPLGEVRRRTGSERQAEYGSALGIIMPGQGYLSAESTVATGSGFTVGFSLDHGDIAKAEGHYPILKLHSGDTDYYKVYLKRSAANGYQIVLSAEGSASKLESATTVVPESKADYVLRLTGTTLTLYDGTTTTTVDTSTLGTFVSAKTLYILGDPDTSITKAEGKYPVIANVGYSESYVSDASTVLGIREALDTSWRLDGSAMSPSVQMADSGVLTLRSNPGRPAQDSDHMHFGGHTGAFFVRHTSVLDRYFQTALSSTAEDAWSVVIEGDRGTDVSGAQTLIDYGDFCTVQIQSDGSVDFTTNGVTLSSSTTNLLGNQTFVIAAGRNGDSRFLEISAPGGDEAVSNSGTEMFPPYLDFSRVPDCYIGASEAPSTGAFTGTLDSIALYPFETRRQVEKGLASFYYDFASGSSADASLNNIPGFTITNATLDGEPVYAPGPIADEPWRSIAGGVAVSGSGPSGYQTSLAARIEDGPVSSKIGPLTFLTSSSKVHVLDSEKSRARTLGLPAPSAVVSTKAIGPGVLDGCVAYGYQAVSYNGTKGPVMRLDPVDATGGQKVILGSTSVTGGDSDSELGETYGQTGRLSAAADRFEASNSGPLTVGENHVFEQHFRLPDWDEDNFKETIWMRGARSEANSSSAHQFWQSNQTALSLDLTSNWTLQCAFRYKTPVSKTNGWNAFGIVGIQKASPTGGSNRAGTNADFAAFVSEGHNHPDASDYGSSANPRLVVCLSRQRLDGAYGGGIKNLSTNYYMLTFSNDGSGFWADGEDYNIQFTRRGAALQVQVHNRTTDTWLDMVGNGNTMTGYTTAHATYGPGNADTRANYDDTNYFQGWTPYSATRTLVWGSTGRPGIRVPLLTAAGDVDHTAIDTVLTTPAYDNSMSIVDGAPSTAVHWHYRAWQDALSFSTFRHNSEERFAAFAGESLESDIYADFAPIFEDETDSDDARYDAVLGLPWYARSDGTTGDTVENFTQDDNNLLAKQHPILVLDTDGTALDSAAIVLYYSALGDGTLTLRGGTEGSFNITERIWDAQSSDAKYVKTRDELANAGVIMPDLDSFNWVAFDVTVNAGAGSARNLTIENMAVNGSVIFDDGFGGTSMGIGSWPAGWIHIGGHADGSSTLDERVNVSEFRMWDDGKGPDLDDGTDFDYLTGRVSENEYTGGTTNLLHYYKFQPDDLVGSVLENYGSEGDASADGNAEIIDERAAQDSGADPAPVVVFPEAPHPDIVGWQLSRTTEVAPVDADVDEDVQTALEIARGLELRSLAFVPVGTSFHTDNTPSEALGLAIDETAGSVPENILSAFPWNGRLALLDDKSQIWPSVAGSAGWESYPENDRFRIPSEEGVGQATAAIEVQDRFGQGQVLVCGRNWGVLVGGSPDVPDVRSLGQIIGASNAQCIAAYSGMAFTFNGKLWAVVDGEQADFGLPVQDLLPDKDNCRLASSAALSSLFVIDTSTGDVLRYHFPTKTWSVEERAARDVGDLDDGAGAWVNFTRTWSKEASVYGDDVPDQTLTLTGTVSGDTITGVAASTIAAQTRCLVVDSAGTEAVVNTVGDITSGTTLTFGSGDLAGLTGSATVYLGVGQTGLLLDTGPLDVGAKVTSRHLEAEVLTGSAWESAHDAATTPGDRSSLSTWDDFAGRQGMTATGRFQRAAVRNRKPEAASVSILEIVL